MYAADQLPRHRSIVYYSFNQWQAGFYLSMISITELLMIINGIQN